MLHRQCELYMFAPNLYLYLKHPSSLFCCHCERLLVVTCYQCLFTPHAERERSKVIGVVSIYSIIMYGPPQNFNRTLVIDSPFQSFAVGLLVEFID